MRPPEVQREEESKLLREEIKRLKAENKDYMNRIVQIEKEHSEQAEVVKL